MPAALSASLLVCGFAPNKDLTLQARKHHSSHASRISVNGGCTHGCMNLASHTWMHEPDMSAGTFACGALSSRVPRERFQRQSNDCKQKNGISCNVLQ